MPDGRRSPCTEANVNDEREVVRALPAQRLSDARLPGRQVGAEELLLDDARRVHDRMRQVGSASRLEIFAGVCHGWQVLTGFLPEADAALAQAAEFLAARDEPAAPAGVVH